MHCVQIFDDRPAEVIEKEFELMRQFEEASLEIVQGLPISSAIAKNLINCKEYLRSDHRQRMIALILKGREINSKFESSYE